MWALHDLVNRKLRDQEVRQAVRFSDKQAVRRRWATKMLAWSQFRRKTPPDITSQAFWSSVVAFLGYIMCDFRGREWAKIQRFFGLLGVLLRPTGQTPVHTTQQKLVEAYESVLQESVRVWSARMSWHVRMDIVWSLQKRVFDVCHWRLEASRAGFEARCQRAIVGCATATVSS